MAPPWFRVAWCPAEGDEVDALGDRETCTLFAGHAGAHNFTFDVGDLPKELRPPLHLPDVTHDERATAPWIAAHHLELLRRHRMTDQTFACLFELATLEDMWGRTSVQHRGGTTAAPAAQLTRIDATTPGAASEVATGYLHVVEDAPYEPVFDGNFDNSVIVELTDHGRLACRVLSKDLGFKN